VLLQECPAGLPLLRKIGKVSVAPCWTLMLAFPQAVQPGLLALGPQWNAARSTHHRIAWLARESSKPGRGGIERWTVQASAQWSADHLQDDEARVQAKLLKAFTEVTGIHAEPAHVDTKRWLYAQTTQPLGESHLWDAQTGLGLCGDWCLGHRVEEAFVSGLELALSIA
jgi:predicted NAD/FAD-dependent oxidoreductase